MRQGIHTHAESMTDIDSNSRQVPEYSLRFDPECFEVKTFACKSLSIRYRAFEDIVYLRHPVDPTHQRMNLFVPEDYYEGKSIGNHRLETAPIFLPNQIGGYLPGEPGSPGVRRGGGANAVAVALSKGYIVAYPGTRGRTGRDENGRYTGKAPAAIVDLKAAVRYLRFNDRLMPGDTGKIISNGTSAGGALSLLLGATGNNADYLPYLEDIGAAQARDDLFAVSCYCPITDLEHADMAYEWQLNGVDDYRKIELSMLDYHVRRKMVAGTLTEKQKHISGMLKTAFPAYLNSLGLKGPDGVALRLDSTGDGSFKTLLSSFLIASAQKALDNGKELSDHAWIEIQGAKVKGIDFDQFAHHAGRMKTAPAFDDLDLASGENQLFGTETIDAQHFTRFGQTHGNKQGRLADEGIVKLMNPMNYLGTEGSTTSRYWRIRHGTLDKDTSLAIPVILATKLQNEGLGVDFALPWDRSHSGDYDLEELFAWMDRISLDKSQDG